jgi:hypothetical protein
MSARPFLVALVLAAVSCHRETAAPAARTAPADSADALVRVGSETITREDVEHRVKENHGGRDDEATRRTALAELTKQAAFVQAARDAGLAADPTARAEISRILASRLRETELEPRLKELASAEIPAARLRELYAARKSRFQSPAKRQVAVLWLNPGADPERAKAYRDKLAQAREWVFSHPEIAEHPEQGFSTLSVDYSEHAASRYKNGVAGWMERGGGMDAWTKAVAEIAFSLKSAGDVSEVTVRPEGMFLVRFMAETAAVQRPFEAVAAELLRAERQRLRQAAEADFETQILSRYPADPPLQPLPAPETATIR